jgi:hypothetical protein
MQRPHEQAGHMAAPTSAGQMLQKILANGAPSTHGLIIEDTAANRYKSIPKEIKASVWGKSSAVPPSPTVHIPLHALN